MSLRRLETPPSNRSTDIDQFSLMYVNNDRSPTKAVAIELTTDNRVWVFGPDDAFQFTYWLSALSETLTKERLRVSDGETKDPS